MPKRTVRLSSCPHPLHSRNDRAKRSLRAKKKAFRHSGVTFINAGTAALDANERLGMLLAQQAPCTSRTSVNRWLNLRILALVLADHCASDRQVRHCGCRAYAALFEASALIGQVHPSTGLLLESFLRHLAALSGLPQSW